MRPDARSLALQAVKWSAASADRIVRPPRGVVLLQYHRVGRRVPLEIDLSPERFEEQMALLSDEGRATTLDHALDVLDGTSVPQRDPVVVTFDDGTADFAELAVPALVRHEIPVTLYLATAFIEDQVSFPHNGAPLSWSAIRDLVATGLVTVGSHTHTHALLDQTEGSLTGVAAMQARNIAKAKLLYDFIDGSAFYANKVAPEKSVLGLLRTVNELWHSEAALSVERLQSRMVRSATRATGEADRSRCNHSVPDRRNPQLPRSS